MPHPHSPLSKSGKTIRRYSLRKERLISLLERYFGSACPLHAEIRDYEIWECCETRLLFAEPAIPGSEVFYRWIARNNGYYPSQRWEYQHTIDRLPKKMSLRIADVGCGDGKFLRLLLDQNSVDVMGIDTLSDSVELCRQKGIPARCGLLNDLLKEDPKLGGAFDYVTSFHCLEHVPEPLTFVKELCELLKPGGTLLISTPLSPMPFEAVWFDPQNHPPHHMTRWNSQAYQSLASQLGMDAQFQYSKAEGFGESLHHAIKYRIAGGPFERISRQHLSRIVGEILLFPVTFVRFSLAWLWAEAPGSNGVLVLFRRKPGTLIG